MAQYCWLRELRPGTEEEYVRRHRELWPEMKEAIHAAGIRDYHIYLHGLQVIGVFQTDDLEATLEFQKSNEAMGRWAAHNKELFQPQSATPPGRMPLVQEVWHLP